MAQLRTGSPTARAGVRRHRGLAGALVVLCLLAMFGGALRAQKPTTYESNFGEVVLAKSELIVLGIASAQRKRVQGAWRAEVTVSEVLHGEQKATELSMLYSDETLLKKDAAVTGLFALRKIAERSYEIVGRPVVITSSEPGRDTRTRVCREFLKLEAREAGDARANAFDELLGAHLSEGGYAARNAAVELIFWVRRKPEQVTRERFDRFAKILTDMEKQLDDRTRADVELALSGMVETKLKSAEFKKVRRSEKNTEKLEAVDELTALCARYPAAWTEDDAKLTDAITADVERGGKLEERLRDLAREIRNAVRLSETRRKDREDRIKRLIENAWE